MIKARRLIESYISEGIGIYSSRSDKDPLLMSYRSFEKYMKEFAPRSYAKFFPSYTIRRGPDPSDPKGTIRSHGRESDPSDIGDPEVLDSSKNPHYGFTGRNKANSGEIDNEVGREVAKELSSSLRKFEIKHQKGQLPSDQEEYFDDIQHTLIKFIRKLRSRDAFQS